jgi:hypothetical protein
MADNSTIMDGMPSANISESKIETIDAAFYDYVEKLNIFCNTNNGWKKIPIIWSSAERSFQIKDNQELRDANGSLIPPIISIERVNTVKDVKNKGSFQANVSPEDDRYFITKILNQDKTSNFANADTKKSSKQINFISSKKNKKIVYQSYSVPIPIYITVEYKINILTSYQSQMNEAVQPFMARTAQNYFIIQKDSHRFECFMDSNFAQESISNLGDQERKYKTSIGVKVLGYLIGEGDNQEKRQNKIIENAVELKLPKENIILATEPVPKNKKQISAGLGNFSTPVSTGIAVKKSFLIGDGTTIIYKLVHNLNTRDIFVTVRENFAPYSVVTVNIDYCDLNHIDIDMGGPISLNSYSVTIIG